MRISLQLPLNAVDCPFDVLVNPSYVTEKDRMERYSTLLLDVWREVGRHIEIGESVARVAPILARRIPVDLLLVRRLDVPRAGLETVATGVCRGSPGGLRPRSECPADLLQRLLRWSENREILWQPAARVRERVTGLLPDGLEGEVLAGPLISDDGPAGVLILATQPPHAFRADHQDLVRSLLDPFTVALENDRRVSELVALREALEADKRSLLSRLERHDITDSIVGAETGLRPVMEQIERVAPADAPVLILGETGSGKEVVARAIHTRSRRAAKPFVRVNCGAIPPELIDSELFGHEKGSFTGAVGARRGWFERADGGTLFLDECGELPAAAQVRLLRILQDGTFERVGGERPMTVDVRIVAATHRDLHALVAAGRFREDLWYRIAVFPIKLPPLRERKEDIPALATHFALRAAKRLGTLPLTPRSDDLDLLLAYPWPGNVRELAAVIERAAILGDGKRLEVAQALGTAPRPLPAAAPAAPKSFEGEPILSLDSVMARHIELALARTHGRIEGPYGVAKLLKINPHTLRARMRKLKINWRRFRGSAPSADLSAPVPRQGESTLD
jgi:transcriptional regulator with GAF, ATPase, and Fis domain